jgi:hypothetical protein
MTICLDWVYVDGLPILLDSTRGVVGAISHGRAAGGFYMQVFRPPFVRYAHYTAWRHEQDERGQNGVLSYAGPARTRKQAVRALMREVYQRSAELLNAEDVDFPEVRLT